MLCTTTYSHVCLWALTCTYTGVTHCVFHQMHLIPGTVTPVYVGTLPGIVQMSLPDVFPDSNKDSKVSIGI